MKIGERGQITIPKHIREKFGLNARTEVEFQVRNGQILLQKSTRKLPLERWVGYCGKSFKKLGYKSVDDYIEEVRGR